MAILFSNFGYLLHGALMTLALACIAIAVGSLLGVAMCLGMVLGPFPVRAILRVWVACIRGVPVLVVMFVSYFAAPELGLNVSGFAAVAFSLTIYIAAFYAEVARGAVRAIPSGQSDAGAAIGLTRMGVLRHVIAPQALPLMVAPWLATSVIAVKSTAYASIVGVWELTLASREVVERTIAPFPIFFGAMLIYFVICFPLSLAARKVDTSARGSV